MLMRFFTRMLIMFFFSLSITSAVQHADQLVVPLDESKTLNFWIFDLKNFLKFLRSPLWHVHLEVVLVVVAAVQLLVHESEHLLLVIRIQDLELLVLCVLRVQSHTLRCSGVDGDRLLLVGVLVLEESWTLHLVESILIL